MGNQIADCCQHTITTGTNVNDLRHQTSASLKLMEIARSKHTNVGSISITSDSGEVSSPPSKSSKSKYTFSIFNKQTKLKLQSIDSQHSVICDDKMDKKTGYGQHQNVASISLSDNTIYSLESSDSENDDILTNDKVIVLSKQQQTQTKQKSASSSSSRNSRISKVFIKIPQSHTKTVDEPSAKVIKYETINTNPNKTNGKCLKKQQAKKNKYKEIMRAKNKNTIHSMGALKEELSECEIKLKQSQHEKEILKRENDALRAKIQAFHAKYGVIDSGFDFNELYTKTTLNTHFKSKSTSTEQGYHDIHHQTHTNIDHSPSQIDGDVHYLLSPKSIISPSSKHSEHNNYAQCIITPPPDKEKEDNLCDTYPNTNKINVISPSASTNSSTPHTPIAINWSNSAASKDSNYDKDKNLHVTKTYKSPSNNSMRQQSNDFYPSIIATASVDTINTQDTQDTDMNTMKIHESPLPDDDDDHNMALTLTLTQMPMALSPSTPDGTVTQEKYNYDLLSPRKKRSASVPSFDDKSVSGMTLDLLCSDDVSIMDIDEESKMMDDYYLYNNNCVSINECDAIKRIIDALKWYAISGDNHESVYKKMKRNNYGKRIVADYNHIMEYHLDDENKCDKEIRIAYDTIVNMISEQVGDCKFIQCAGYRRYLRCKNTEHGHNHQAQNKDQHELQMCVNTMDGIHCCFMHLAKSLR